MVFVLLNCVTNLYNILCNSTEHDSPDRTEEKKQTTSRSLKVHLAHWQGNYYLFHENPKMFLALKTQIQIRKC